MARHSDRDNICSVLRSMLGIVVRFRMDRAGGGAGGVLGITLHVTMEVFCFCFSLWLWLAGTVTVGAAFSFGFVHLFSLLIGCHQYILAVYRYCQYIYVYCWTAAAAFFLSA